MITSIFKKSKPINFIIVFFITLLAFYTAKIKLIQDPDIALSLAKQVALFLVCYVSVLLVNFIVSKHSLTKKNNYEILLFSLFLLAMPNATGHTNILLANFFILLGYRRIISLRSMVSIKKKLFDAAFWITIATLFYFWSILFLIMIFAALFLYTDNRVKHWLIPFTGVLTVAILAMSLSILEGYGFFGWFKTLPQVSYDFTNYNTLPYLIAITMMFSFGVWSAFFFLKIINNKKKTLRPSFKLVFLSLNISLAIIVIAPNKNGSEFLFFFTPLSIIITNYIETIQEKWFREIFLLLLIIAPFVLLFL